MVLIDKSHTALRVYCLPSDLKQDRLKNLHRQYLAPSRHLFCLTKDPSSAGHLVRISSTAIDKMPFSRERLTGYPLRTRFRIQIVRALSSDAVCHMRRRPRRESLSAAKPQSTAPSNRVDTGPYHEVIRAAPRRAGNWHRAGHRTRAPRRLV